MARSSQTILNAIVAEDVPICLIKAKANRCRRAGAEPAYQARCVTQRFCRWPNLLKPLDLLGVVLIVAVEILFSGFLAHFHEFLFGASAHCGGGVACSFHQFDA